MATGPERRRQVLTDQDIERLCNELMSRQPVEHKCVISKDDLKILPEVFQYYRNMNKVFGGTGRVIWYTFIIGLVTGLFGFIYLGVQAWLRIFHETGSPGGV